MTIETKYNIEDKVWFIARDRVWCLKVESIAVGITLSTRISYGFNSGDPLFGCFNIPEDCLFPTKEELLKSL